MEPDILVTILDYSSQFSVDPNLVKAVCKKESGWISWRTRFEPEWKTFYFPLKYSEQLGESFETECKHQATSWGLMQVMGTVARELGLDDYITKLSQPTTGLYYGIKKLSLLCIKYPDIHDAVSAYNAGHPTPKNKKYVDDVMANYLSYRGDPHV